MKPRNYGRAVRERSVTGVRDTRAPFIVLGRVPIAQAAEKEMMLVLERQKIQMEKAFKPVQTRSIREIEESAEPDAGWDDEQRDAAIAKKAQQEAELSKVASMQSLASLRSGEGDSDDDVPDEWDMSSDEGEKT